MLLVVRTAAAQADIAWRAPEECPSAEVARAQIAALSQRDAVAADAIVVIERLSSTVLEARVAVVAANGQREHVLHDASCSVLTHAAALIVALAASPKSAAERGRKASGSRHVTQVTSGLGGGASPRTSARESAEPLANAGLDGAGARASADSRPPSAHGLVELPPGAADAAIDSPPAAAEERGAERNAPTAPAQKLSARDLIPTRGDRPSSERPSAPALRATKSSAEAVRISQPAPHSHDDEHAQSASPVFPLGSPLRIFLGLAASLSSGDLPTLAPTAALSAGVLFHNMRVGLRLAFAPSQHSTLTNSPGAGGRVALAHAAFEAGTSLFSGALLEVPLLAGLESGLFVGQGYGVPEKQTRVAPWLAPFLSSGISHTWAQRWRVALLVQGLVALSRPRFALDIEGQSPVVFHRPSLFGARMFFSLEWVIP